MRHWPREKGKTGLRSGGVLPRMYPSISHQPWSACPSHRLSNKDAKHVSSESLSEKTSTAGPTRDCTGTADACGTLSNSSHAPLPLPNLLQRILSKYHVLYRKRNLRRSKCEATGENLNSCHGEKEYNSTQVLIEDDETSAPPAAFQSTPAFNTLQHHKIASQEDLAPIRTRQNTFTVPT